MSDEEYEYDYDSDGDENYDYGSDQDNQGDGGIADELIEIENAYYEGDDVKIENPQQAIELFEKVVTLETNRGDAVKWRFLALQHLVTLYFTLKIYEKMIDKYRSMLDYMGAVTRNECTDAINTILEIISKATISGVSTVNIEVMSEMYKITLQALKKANNERLWFITNHKLAKLYLEGNKHREVEELLRILKQSCMNPDGTDDVSKGTYLLEIYCLEIQLCTATNNNARMRQVYPRTMNLNAAVVDPRIMGVIREEGGKMQMREGNWDLAYDELYEAFRSYQEAGNTRAKDCLKYVVLASMLALKNINPFDAREAKVYADDKEILAMSELRQSLEANDLSRFERILNNKSNRICDEPLLMTYIPPLRRRMHEQVLLNLIIPYHKVSVSFIALELQLEAADVEGLLVDMILENRLDAQIDQINSCVLLKRDNSSVDNLKLAATAKWAESISRVIDNFNNRIEIR